MKSQEELSAEAARAAATAEWMWPALCVMTLWGLGLLLHAGWLLSWLGAGVAAFTALAMIVIGMWRRSLLSAAWGGGAVFFGLALVLWGFAITVY